MPVKYQLIGPNKGKSETYHGIKFVNGIAIVSDEYEKNAGHMLREHYSAFPENQVKEAEAKWEKAQEEHAELIASQKEVEAEKLRAAVEAVSGGGKRK